MPGGGGPANICGPAMVVDLLDNFILLQYKRRKRFENKAEYDISPKLETYTFTYTTHVNDYLESTVNNKMSSCSKQLISYVYKLLFGKKKIHVLGKK